ncbi:hypothetical protein AB0910_00405 [Streptomyces sp. NPDC047002]|uniref:hypothetical protein n=1 Tax=Streptomyces sp. NPDC047002 TaxID=3155475 RepID=UPI0034560E93
MMTNNSKIGAALVGGYLLGRTKKAKMAIGLGMFLAGKKLDLDPRRLASAVADSPLLGGLNDQVRKELVDTTKSAAASALTRRIGGLADSLHDRALRLEDGGDGSGDDGGGEPPSSDRDRDRDESSEDAEESGEGGGRADDGEDGRSRSAAPRKTASSGARKASSGTRKASGAARKASSGARKTSASGARKTGSAARGSASRGNRKTSGRGGDDRG